MTKIDLPPRKKVGHLTLLRSERPISAREYNALAFRERLEMVRDAQGRQKYALIVEARDSARLVRQLPAQELYLLMQDLGAEDVVELVEFASTEQLTAFIDLDAWCDEELQPSSALRWITLLLEAGEETVLQAAQIEIELLALMMKKLLVILRGPEAFEDDDDLENATRFESLYEIEYHDSEAAKLVAAFLDILFTRERITFLRLMETVRGELDSVLEEEVYRQRSGRLQELGFADPLEARSLFAFVDPDRFDPESFRRKGSSLGQETVTAPLFALSLARPRDLLAEVLSAGVDEQTCWELSYLLNKFMSAEKVTVGETKAVQEAMEEVYRYLNLALEYLNGGEVERLREIFATTYLQGLFRLGFSLTEQLRRRALKVRRSSVGPYLDGPYQALVEGLCRPRPRFYEGIDQAERAGERAFATLLDLHRAAEWLERVEVQQRLFEDRFPFDLPAPDQLDLSGCLPEEPELVTLSDFFLTALAGRLLGREFLPVPVPRQELRALHSLVCGEGGLNDQLKDETLNWLETLEPGAGAFGEFCLELWQEEFCSLQAESLDPRYLGGLLVRLD